MDTETLFAFAATYPTIFAEMMADASEHIVLSGDTAEEWITHTQYVPSINTGWAGND